MSPTTHSSFTATRQAVLHALEDVEGIEQVVLFGSMAQGSERLESDVDVAVEASQPLSAEQKIALIEVLALAFGRSVDLVDLKTAGQPLLTQIVATGVRLKGSDTAWARLVYRNIIDNEDFVPLQQRILRARQKAWIKR